MFIGPKILAPKWVIFLLILSLNVFTSLALSNEGKGGRKMKVGEMKNLNKDEIVKMAVDRIKESYPDFEEKSYDIKKVLAGNDVIIVKFNLSYIYVPQNIFLYYEIKVSFYNENSPSLSIGSIKNPLELDTSKLEEKFFKPNVESKKAIEFVKKVFQREDMKVSDPVKIMDNNEYFEVTVLEEGMIGGFKINKKSKEIYDRWHKETLDHLNPQNRELKEIK